jgi:hypothetical protein
MEQPINNYGILNEVIDRYYANDVGCMLVLKRLSMFHTTSPFESFIKYLMEVHVITDCIRVIKDIFATMPKDDLNIPLYHDNEQLIIIIMACLNNPNTKLLSRGMYYQFAHLKECCKVILSSDREFIKTYYAKIFATLLINDPYKSEDYWPRLRDVITGNHSQNYKRSVDAAYTKLSVTEEKLRILQEKYDILVMDCKQKDRARDKEIRRRPIEDRLSFK